MGVGSGLGHGRYADLVVCLARPTMASTSSECEGAGMTRVTKSFARSRKVQSARRSRPAQTIPRTQSEGGGSDVFRSIPAAARRGVRDELVPNPVQDYGMIRRDAVKFIARGMPALGEKTLIPTATQNPLASGN